MKKYKKYMDNPDYEFVPYSQGEQSDPSIAQVEKQENIILPDGGFIQADASTHEQQENQVNPDGNYHLPEGAIIFSDRLKPDFSKLTYAQLNKPNNTNREDKILDNNNSTQESKRTAELMKKVKAANSQELFEHQEAQKAFNFDSGLYKYGGSISYKNGGIHIKPSAKGSFTRWAKNHGMSVSEAASKVMANKDSYSSAIVKKANFAKNAAGWKHADGGTVSMPKGEFMNEHKELVKILRSGSKAEQLAEANEQAEEMKKYPYGGPNTEGTYAYNPTTSPNYLHDPNYLAFKNRALDRGMVANPGNPNVYRNINYTDFGGLNVPLPGAKMKYNQYTNYLPQTQKIQKVEFANGGIKSDIQSSKLYNKMYNFKVGDRIAKSPYRQYVRGGFTEPQGFFGEDPYAYADYNADPNSSLAYNQPWWKGVGHALQGEINSGRMTMTQPSTQGIGQLEPNKTNYRTTGSTLDNTPDPRISERKPLNWQDKAYYAAGTLAQSAGPLAYLYDQGKKYDTQKFYDYNPETVRFNDKPFSTMKNMARYDLANASAGNAAAYRANYAGTSAELANAEWAARNANDAQNAATRNAAQQFNIGNRYRTDDINAMRKGQALTNYYQSIGALGENTASGMKDYRANQMDDQRIGMLKYIYQNPEFMKFLASQGKVG